jgi:hypothetical protein
VFVLLARNGDADAVSSQVVAELPAAVCFVANNAPGPAPRTPAPAPAPLHGAVLHQGCEDHGLVPLARWQHQRHQLPTSCRAYVACGAEPALAAAQGVGLRAPFRAPSGRLVRPDEWAITIVRGPSALPCGIGLLLDRGTQAGPEARLAPTIETAGDGPPGAIPFGQIAPGSPGTQEPQDAIAEAAMVGRRASRPGFLGWEQWL